MTKIKIYLYILLLVGRPMAFAEAPNPCDPQKELLRENFNKRCSAKKQRSSKVWNDLETAQGSIINAIKNNDANTIVDYVGCDASDLARHEVICESHLPIITKDHILKTFSYIVKSSKKVLDNIKWINYGVSKDLYLLCTKNLKIKVAQNYCGDDKSYQPIIEIHKNGDNYYISGVILTK